MANKNQKEVRRQFATQMKLANKGRRSPRSERKIVAKANREKFEKLAKEVNLTLPVYNIMAAEHSHEEIKFALQATVE